MEKNDNAKTEETQKSTEGTNLQQDKKTAKTDELPEQASKSAAAVEAMQVDNKIKADAVPPKKLEEEKFKQTKDKTEENNVYEDKNSVKTEPASKSDAAVEAMQVNNKVKANAVPPKKLEEENIKQAKDEQQRQNELARFAQKVATLQEKTKCLRDKLGVGKSILEQRQLEVKKSPEILQQNDKNASRVMLALGATTPATASTSIAKKAATPQGILNSVSGSSPLQVLTVDGSGQNKSISTNHTRRVLQEQVEGLQELLAQLTMYNPQLQMCVAELAKGNPKLQQLELFPNLATAGVQHASTSRPRQVSERSSTNYHQQTSRTTQRSGKSRHESEVSNASSLTSQKDHTNTASSNNNNDENVKKSRRRVGHTKKNRSHKPQRTQTEQEALAKYINTIVAEYLGNTTDQKERDVIPEFKGTTDDLEAYAQHLVKSGLGRIVEDEIRINRKNNRQSFITMSTDRDAVERDGIVLLPAARRYAFEGDIVRAFVMKAVVASTAAVSLPIEEKKKPKESVAAITGGKEHSFCIADDEDPFANDDDETETPDSDADPNELLDTSTVLVSDNCPKAFVISIVKQTELRQIVGTISFKNTVKLNEDKNNDQEQQQQSDGSMSYYKLKPHDMRVPMVYIPVNDASATHITSENKNDICGFLYLVQVRETDASGHCIGELLQPVGKVGNLEAEIKAILLHNGMRDICPYEERFNDMFAQPDPPISSADLSQREDLRKKCIFTIDPLTARDLDDAMSVEVVSENEFEVGVHISDVSHYLVEDCELDNIVKDRATSIYLVNEVIHMLPKPLCFKCSLLPGEDKFSFSVFWRMNKSGELLAKPRFTRSIINSCTQFAYEHAQKIIDNPKEIFGIDDLPTIGNGFTPDEIARRVLLLHNIAQHLRNRRYDNGALSINNPKLYFNLDPKSGEPIGFDVDGRQEANFLIEEFMLLANQSVARFIYDRFPDTSILRNHAPPLSKSMKALREKLASVGIEFDCSSSKAIYESMQRVCRTAKDPAAMDACLSTLLTKPMARAKYFCSEGKSEESDLWHYALSIPIYTHFTSPIRRYPDILVHRLLAAALNYCPPPKRTTDELHAMAKVCNDQKFNAKNAGEESSTLFFKRYIRSKQSITLRAVVTEIFQHLVNVVTIETGHAISINYKVQKVLVDTANTPSYLLISEKNSKSAPLKLQIFSTVEVKLVIWDDKICGFFVSPDPKQRQLNSIESSKKKQPTGASSNSNNDIRKPRHNSQEQAQHQASTSKSKKDNRSKIRAQNFAIRRSELNRRCYTDQ